MIVTVYRKPVLERSRDQVSGKLSEYESTWRRTKILEVRDVEVMGVFWPRAHLDFGSPGGLREFSLRSGRGLGLMRDWVLKPEDCRALRLQYAPHNRRKRRKVGRDEADQKHIRSGGSQDEASVRSCSDRSR